MQAERGGARGFLIVLHTLLRAPCLGPSWVFSLGIAGNMV
ncbi:hypothetical protein C8J27_101603 [Rhodobacter aestuarii]|uniref:Uncharacterized protein n=1 Tax=Rhodobacter aestuarii TaxID=453582 RepID=A0A1N7IVF9_9RHOB|nr:hypothetical protein C8J27_101603 [Rhodobacter aestuarii]SIS41085.1 hypothetical protein SAMN05421580_10139 [Rhodobacter aestuarii]SOC05590.1 hypothetical protein SAMN05877809_103459 [Rhodobacter sp. JA431]